MSMPMLAGVGLLIVCCVSSSFAASMGGEETPIASTVTTPSTPSTPDDTTLEDDVEDCTIPQTDWINNKIQEDGMPQSQGESLQKCKVPNKYQARIEPVAFCDVAKTDWINSKLQEDGMPQSQGESLQKCKVPNNLQARIQ